MIDILKRAFKAFFEQLSYRLCVGCELLYERKRMVYVDNWMCQACSKADPIQCLKRGELK